MPCSPFGAKARSQQTQTPAIPLTRPRFGQIQHRVTYHPPPCQGMRANGRIQRRRFRRTRHEKTNEPTSPRARPRPRPRLSPSPSPSPNHRLRARAVLAQGRILPRILPSGRGSALILPSESRLPCPGHACLARVTPCPGRVTPGEVPPLYMFDLHTQRLHQNGPFFPADINSHFNVLDFEFFACLLNTIKEPLPHKNRNFSNFGELIMNFISARFSITGKEETLP